MIEILGEPRIWLRTRWLLVIALVTVLQTGLIFWLGAPKLGGEPRLNSGPRIYMPPDQRSELPGGNNPTVFVLANRHGFSGTAWLGFSPVQNTLPDWTEPVRLLPCPVQKLGQTLSEFVATNSSSPLEVARKPEPQLEAVELYLAPELTPAQSTLSIEGQLADRPLISELKLKSWPAADILTNSVVLTAVDQNGGVFSSVLLGKSGSKEADDNALSLVKIAHFQPLRGGGRTEPGAAAVHLIWGRLIFHWQTLALTSNSVSSLR